jgi:hypothetical protein
LTVRGFRPVVLVIIVSKKKALGCKFSEHMEDIVSLTFQYIRILELQGVVRWLYEEVCNLLSSLSYSIISATK